MDSHTNRAVIHCLIEEAVIMGDFFWFSDAQCARIEPLLPTDVRGKPGEMIVAC